jgi:hypothetical protein
MKEWAYKIKKRGIRGIENKGNGGMGIHWAHAQG